jgi:hypothetical protein
MPLAERLGFLFAQALIGAMILCSAASLAALPHLLLGG